MSTEPIGKTMSGGGGAASGGGVVKVREDTPTLSVMRRGVRLLKQAVAEGAAERGRLEGVFAERTGTARVVRDRVVARVEDERGAGLSRLASVYAERVGEVEAAYARGVKEAQGQRTREREMARERGQRDLAESKKQRDEGVWFAETCLETDRTKIKAQRAADVQQIGQMNGRVEMVRAQAEQLLAEWRQNVALTPGSVATESAEPMKVFELGIGKAEEGIDRMVGYKTPGLIRGVVPWVIVFAVAAVAGVCVSWARGWVVDIAVGGGFLAGVLGGAVVMFMVHGSVRRRTRELLGPLAEGLGQARGAIEAQSRVFDLEDRRRQEEAQGQFDSEVGKAKGRHERHQKQLQDRLGEIAGRVEEGLAAALMRVESAKTEGLAAAERDRAAGVAEVERAAAEGLAEAERVFAAETEGARREYEEGWARLAAAWGERAGRVMEDVGVVEKVLGPARVAWGRLAGGNGVEGFSFSPTPVIEAAGVELDVAGVVSPLEGDERMPLGLAGKVVLPVPLEVPGGASLALLTGAGDRGRATELLSAVMLRILSTLPPGKARFTIIDPVGLGQSFAGFMRLNEFATTGGSLVGERIWTEARHVEQKLADITEHMETVIQKYLRNQYATIDAYNAAAGEVAEPYRFVVIADFPTNITEVSAKRLESILASGARCGVYVLLAATKKEGLPQGIKWSDVSRACQVMTLKDGKWSWGDGDFAGLPVVVSAGPTAEEFSLVADKVGAAAMEASRVRVPFGSIAPRPDEEWTRSTAEGVRVPIGRAGATKLQHLQLGSGTQQHVLIAGRTGSGKSTLLNVIITAASLWHSPDEVEMYLVDFKKGVEFKAYATARLPHARVIAVESEREFGLSVLRRLDAELTRRGDLFRGAGVQSLPAYRVSAGAERMPRVLLIVDEFQEFFIEDDKLAQEAGLLMDRLVRQGRAFGMHVILGSQTLAGAYSLARSTMGQMGVRIALQCSEADSYLILADDNPAARLLNRPGEAIYNDASGMLEGNNPFQVTWLEDQERAERIGWLAGKVKTAGLDVPGTIVFEGNAPAKAEEDAELAGLVERPGLKRAGGLKFSVGAPISIKEPTGAPLRRRSASNLLLVGQNEEQALGMLSVGIAGLLLQDAGAAAGERGRVVLMDGTPADTAMAGVLSRVTKAGGGRVEEVEYRGVGAAVGRLHEELQRRLADEGGATGAAPVVLVIAGLQRFRLLQKGEDDFGFGGEGDDVAKPDKQLAALVREGPAVGMHVVVWCDSASNLERFFKRQSLGEFDARVLLQMSVNDSSNLIDSPAAGSLGRDRALLFSEERGTVERFRPYALPPEGWLEKVGRAVLNAGGGT